MFRKWQCASRACLPLVMALGMLAIPSIRFTAEVASNNILPFIGVKCIHTNSALQTAVHHKSTDTGLLLHFHSHVDSRYKRSLLHTMIHRAYRISSSWHHLNAECDLLRRVFLGLQYPASLIETTIKKVISTSIQPPQASDHSKPKPIRMVLPYKSDDASRSLRAELNYLNNRLHLNMQAVFTSNE